MVALDTNVAIMWLKSNFDLPFGVTVDDFALPATVIGEMLFGARNSGRPAANLTLYRGFFSNLSVLFLDKLAAEYYAEIRLALKQKGRPIPENDMWIAAICRAHDVPLFTFDRHFAEVSGLALVAL